jgi:hypothetical protein
VYLGKKGALGYVLSLLYGVVELKQSWWSAFSFCFFYFGSLLLMSWPILLPWHSEEDFRVLESYYYWVGWEFVLQNSTKCAIRTEEASVICVYSGQAEHSVCSEEDDTSSWSADQNSKQKIQERTRMQDQSTTGYDHIHFTCSKGIMGRRRLQGITDLIPATEKCGPFVRS